MKKTNSEGNESSRKIRRVGNTILAWLLVFLVVVVLLVVAFWIYRSIGKHSLFSKTSSQRPETMEEEREAEWEEGWVRHDGKVYKYNEDILVFLALGIDIEGEVKENVDLVSGGQSDAIFLVIVNPDTKEISLIGVNRDTMVDILMVGLGEDGTNLVTTAQLTVQHGFGDGMQGSCMLTEKAVSKLFYNLPIHGYLSFNLGGLGALNDAVGGVEVTMMSDMTAVNPSWTEGATVTLNGNDVYQYIRVRDITVFESARMRLERQKNYLNTLVRQMIEETKKDISLPITLYGMFSKYIVTDLTPDEISYLASELVSYKFSGNIYTLEGATRMGEEFEEFYPDKTALKELMIKVFYDEVDESEMP